MKNFKISLLLILSLLLAPWAQAEEKANKTQAAYEWIKAVQNPSGLVSTREGKEGFCFVYDQALAVYLFLLFDDIERAEKLLNFFYKKYEDQLKRGHFIGFVDMYFSTGAAGATYRAGGPNAWLLNAINEYTYKTGKDTYLAFGEAIADWLIELQAIDGGMMGGHHPNLHFISTEHNADAYAALRNLYFLTKKEIYAEKAEEFKQWLLDVAYVQADSRFGNGKDDINYALDTSSWTVLSLGKEVEEVLDIAEVVAQNTQYYEFTQTNVEGFDFGGPYYDTPFPDKDSVWFEGTAQMVLAYQAVGQTKKAKYFLDQMEQCLTESTYHPKTYGLPYASNPGTPAYGGWQMTNTPLCLSSTAWYLFAKYDLNPFNLGGTLLLNTKKFPFPPKGIKPVDYVKKQFAPVLDDFEGTQAQILTSYPLTQIVSQNSIFNRTIEFNQRASGEKALRILFVPRNISGVRGELAGEEVYNFDAPPEESIIVTTSSQPESITDDEPIEQVEQVETQAPSEQLKKESLAFFYRKFLTPQKWKKHRSLKFLLKHDNSTNFFFVRLKDAKGKTWTSEPISLERKGWQQHKIALKETDLSNNEITEVGFGLSSGTPIMETIVYLDDITLE